MPYFVQIQNRLIEPQELFRIIGLPVPQKFRNENLKTQKYILL